MDLPQSPYRDGVADTVHFHLAAAITRENDYFGSVGVMIRIGVARLLPKLSVCELEDGVTTPALERTVNLTLYRSSASSAASLTLGSSMNC